MMSSQSNEDAPELYVSRGGADVLTESFALASKTTASKEEASVSSPKRVDSTGSTSSCLDKDTPQQKSNSVKVASTGSRRTTQSDWRELVRIANSDASISSAAESLRRPSTRHTSRAQSYSKPLQVIDLTAESESGKNSNSKSLPAGDEENSSERRTDFCHLCKLSTPLGHKVPVVRLKPLNFDVPFHGVPPKEPVKSKVKPADAQLPRICLVPLTSKSIEKYQSPHKLSSKKVHVGAAFSETLKKGKASDYQDIKKPKPKKSCRPKKGKHTTMAEWRDIVRLANSISSPPSSPNVTPDAETSLDKCVASGAKLASATMSGSWQENVQKQGERSLFTLFSKHAEPVKRVDCNTSEDNREAPVPHEQSDSALLEQSSNDNSSVSESGKMADSSQVSPSDLSGDRHDGTGDATSAPVQGLQGDQARPTHSITPGISDAGMLSSLIAKMAARLQCSPESHSDLLEGKKAKAPALSGNKHVAEERPVTVNVQTERGSPEFDDLADSNDDDREEEEEESSSSSDESTSSSGSLESSKEDQSDEDEKEEEDDSDDSQDVKDTGNSRATCDTEMSPKAPMTPGESTLLLLSGSTAKSPGREQPQHCVTNGSPKMSHKHCISPHGMHGTNTTNATSDVSSRDYEVVHILEQQVLQDSLALGTEDAISVADSVSSQGKEDTENGDSQDSNSLPTKSDSTDVDSNPVTQIRELLKSAKRLELLRNTASKIGSDKTGVKHCPYRAPDFGKTQPPLMTNVLDQYSKTNVDMSRLSAFYSQNFGAYGSDRNKRLERTDGSLPSKTFDGDPELVEVEGVTFYCFSTLESMQQVTLPQDVHQLQQAQVAYRASSPRKSRKSKKFQYGIAGNVSKYLKKQGMKKAGNYLGQRTDASDDVMDYPEYVGQHREPHTIQSPSKTMDITRIKGWKSKFGLSTENVRRQVLMGDHRNVLPHGHNEMETESMDGTSTMFGDMVTKENQPSKGKIYGRRFDGKFATKAGVARLVKKASPSVPVIKQEDVNITYGADDTVQISGDGSYSHVLNTTKASRKDSVKTLDGTASTASSLKLCGKSKSAKSKQTVHRTHKRVNINLVTISDHFARKAASALQLTSPRRPSSSHHHPGYDQNELSACRKTGKISHRLTS